MNTLQRILNAEKDARRSLRKHPRVLHKIWSCVECGHRYFYAVTKCPYCESTGISQSKIQLDNQ